MRDIDDLLQVFYFKYLYLKTYGKIKNVMTFSEYLDKLYKENYNKDINKE
jgi:hypothetical protein